MTSGRIAFLGGIYPACAEYLYARHPGLENESHARQRELLLDAQWGWELAYIDALGALGWNVEYFACNVKPLQTRWADEAGASWTDESWLFDIAAAQLECFEPDILWVEDVFTIDKVMVGRLRERLPSVRRVVCYMGVGADRAEILPTCDLIYSCAPTVVRDLVKRGLNAAVVRHAFEPRARDALKSVEGDEDEAEVAASFVGSLFYEFHRERFELIRRLCRESPLEVWTSSLKRGVGSIAEAGVASLFRGRLREFVYLELNLPVRRRWRGEVYGLDMYRVLARSGVTLNCHTEDAGVDAGNQRIFEATGVGACVLTDWRARLPDIFEPDTEVVVYRNADECVEKLNWLLEHPDERRSIACAGQDRTLRDHTYRHRAAELSESFEELLATS